MLAGNWGQHLPTAAAACSGLGRVARRNHEPEPLGLMLLELPGCPQHSFISPLAFHCTSQQHRAAKHRTLHPLNTGIKSERNLCYSLVRPLLQLFLNNSVRSTTDADRQKGNGFSRKRIGLSSFILSEQCFKKKKKKVRIKTPTLDQRH